MPSCPPPPLPLRLIIDDAPVRPRYIRTEPVVGNRFVAVPDDAPDS